MDHSGNVIATKGTLKVIDCVKCGYAHLDPLPDAMDVAKYYKDDYYGNDLWWRGELAEHTRGLWDTAYRFQAQLLGGMPVVDWGCGAGFFPMWWRQNVDRYRSYGIEPNDYARSYFDHGYVVADAAMLPTGTFNHRASLVFEHVVKPRVLLAQMKQRLWKKILIIVPHDGPTNPLQVRLNSNNHWIHEQHLNYWSPRGLTNLLEGMGMRVTYRGATFPMELWCLAGFNYLKSPELGTKCHLARLRFEKAVGPMAFRLYHTLFRTCGFGRELLYVAEG